jgi:hypothetical protein
MVLEVLTVLEVHQGKPSTTPSKLSTSSTFWPSDV